MALLQLELSASRVAEGANVLAAHNHLAAAATIRVHSMQTKQALCSIQQVARAAWIWEARDEWRPVQKLLEAMQRRE